MLDTRNHSHGRYVGGGRGPDRLLNHSALREPEYFPAMRTKEHAVLPCDERNPAGLCVNFCQLLAAMTADGVKVVTFDDGHRFRFRGTHGVLLYKHVLVCR